jgi:hypothetical protein
MSSMLPHEEIGHSAKNTTDHHPDGSAVGRVPQSSGAPARWVNAEPERRTPQPRVRRRKPPITDGPFAESKEMLGGYAPPGASRR